MSIAVIEQRLAQLSNAAQHFAAQHANVIIAMKEVEGLLAAALGSSPTAQALNLAVNTVEAVASDVEAVAAPVAAAIPAA